MQTLTSFITLLPIVLLLIQASVILYLFSTMLKKLRLIRTPYAGMEYSHVVIAAAIIFGAFIISLSDVSNLFQSYKTYANQGTNVAQNTFIKFGQLLLVVLFIEILFAAIVFVILRVAAGRKNMIESLENGSLPLAIFLAVIIISFALVLGTIAKELADLITPKFLSFQ